jgi:NADPH:quinone reductase-like Zn-dependent oxidoreductase
MKAVQMTGVGGPEVLHLVDLPDPKPGPGQVLIRVESAAVNFSDVMRRRGDDYPVPTTMPFVPGAEVAGTVVDLGEGIEGLEVGTAVFAIVGANQSGGYAELALAYAPNVIPIPAGLEPNVAAGIIVAGLGATIMLTETAALQSGQSIFIPAAAGGVGGYAVQIAKLLGAGTVIGGASTPEKRQIASDFGADHTVDYRQAGWTDTVREITGGDGVDVALEMSGGDQLAKTLGILAPFGRLVVFGSVSGTIGRLEEADLIPFLYDPAPNQMLIGFNLGPWFELRLPTAIGALQRLVEWVASGQIKVPVSQTLPLAEAAEAHRLIESGATTGKIVLNP